MEFFHFKGGHISETALYRATDKALIEEFIQLII